MHEKVVFSLILFCMFFSFSVSVFKKETCLGECHLLLIVV